MANETRAPISTPTTLDAWVAHLDAVDLPIIIYNIPPRSVVDMSVETMARLAEFPNIVGLKDATGDLKQISELIRLCAGFLDQGQALAPMPGREAGFLAAVASLADSNDEAEVRKILEGIPDPVGTFYRYSLPAALLARKRLTSHA